MPIYLLKRYIPWATIGVLAVALIVYSIKLFKDHRIVRIAVSENDPLSYELWEISKQILARENLFRVALVKTESSKASQLALLQDEADLAIVYPAALDSLKGMTRIAPLAKARALGLISEKKLAAKGFGNNQSLTDRLNTFSGSLNAQNTDTHALFKIFFDRLGLSEQFQTLQSATLEEGLADMETDFRLMIASAGEQRVRDMVKLTSFRLFDLPGRALAESEIFFESDAFFADTFLPELNNTAEQPIQSFFTPVTLVARNNLNATMAIAIANTMRGANAQIELAAYGASLIAESQTYTLIPEHRDVKNYYDSQIFQTQFANILAWWSTYWIPVMIVSAIVLAFFTQWKRQKIIEQSNMDKLTLNAFEKGIHELLQIEQQLYKENSLKGIENLRSRVLHEKERGLKILLQSNQFSSHQSAAFLQQCHSLLEQIHTKLTPDILHNSLNPRPENSLSTATKANMISEYKVPKKLAVR